MKDLHLLPKVRDSWSYLYLEHCKIDQDGKAIARHDAAGKVPIPCASLNLIMLGPGTSISHAAVRSLADNGCLVAWTGEEGVRMYAFGTGETRSAANLLRQTRLWSSPEDRLQVVRRMYELRFSEPVEKGLGIEQLRGREGIRVRDTYARMSKLTGVQWAGRSYKRESWTNADPINRALSAANSCLYGVCHAAIIAAGFSPAIGFIHTGKMLSFVYDVADVYKTELTIPVAFREAVDGSAGLESRVRHAMRDSFHQGKLLQRLIPDIDRMLGIPAGEVASAFDSDDALPGELWDPEGDVSGGVNYSGDEEE